MTKTILMSASILALVAAVPAMAETRVEGNATVKTEESVGAKVEKQLDRAGNAIENAADKTGKAIDKAAHKTEAAAKETYGDVKAYFTDDKNLGATSTVSIAGSHTAKALVGTDVVDPAGKTIGKISDIIIDREGDAEWVVIEDGGVLGLGTKQAAFDYDIIKGFNRDKDVSVKLTEATLKAAKPFEYKASANAQGPARTTLAADQFSVKELMSANVIGPDGKKIADVETLVFEGDDAEYLLVSFDKILGIGGDTAALDFDALDITKMNDKYSFKLNSQQTAQFENFKKQTKSN